MQQNKWLLQEFDKEKVLVLKEQLDLPEVVLKILLNRGFSDANSIKDFILPQKENLINPFLLDGMYQSVCRIKLAIEQQEKILIYADRDVDGITSLVILFNTIYILGGDVVWYIPSDEGYGMSCSVLDKYHTDGIKLVITVDCGISSTKEVLYANSLNIDVIVTDHHEPPLDGVPAAYAVVDPKQSLCLYPFKELAGCGVAFKTAQALMQTYGKYFDKEIFVVAVCNNSDTSNIYSLKLVNDIIVCEKEIFFLDTDKESFLLSLKDSKIITNDNLLFQDLDNDTEIFNITETISLKETAYELLKQYRKKDFENDGRMLEFFENNVDLAALGTIADIVPLVDENRILVKTGLEVLNNNLSKRFGLSYIFDEYLRNKGVISAKSIAWNVTPVLNAAGRMGKASVSAELLLADDKYKAGDYFAELKHLNNERKQLQVENIKQFDFLLKQQCDIERDKIFVVSADNLLHGVTGIVASQIVKFYGKPVILFIEDKYKGEATGACRSIEGFDIVAALDKTKDLLVRFGGHHQAAGLTIKIDKIESFRQKIKQIAQETISKEMVSKKITVDCELKISDINKKTYNDIMMLEPFGAANTAPVFLVKNVELTEISVIGQTQEHLRLKICKDGSNVPALFWNGAKYQDMMNYKGRFDVLFNMDLNRDCIQIIILDIKNI